MAIGNTAKLSIEIGIDSKTGKYNLRQISSEVDKFGKKTKRAGKEADKSFKKMDKSASSFSGTLGSLKGAIGGIAGALAVREIVQMGTSFFQTGIKVDRLTRSLETATGSFDSATKAQEFLRAESERLGLVYLDQIKGYRDISAASKSYNLSTRETEEIYLGVAEAATAMQMTQDDVNGVFRAFTQILSKGKLQAEEIRGQIGERLPGAFDKAAKAMGVTVAELSKMLDLGQVMSEDFIPKFARQLRMEFAGGLEKAAQSAQANINRLKNTWVEMQIAVLGSGAMDTFQASVKGINSELKEWLDNNDEMLKQKVPEYLDTITEAAKLTGKALSGVVWTAKQFFWVRDVLKEVGEEIGKTLPQAPPSFWAAVGDTLTGVLDKWRGPEGVAYLDWVNSGAEKVKKIAEETAKIEVPELSPRMTKKRHVSTKEELAAIKAEKDRIAKIDKIITALEREEKAYQKTVGEIKIYGQEQVIVAKGDTDRTRILIENFKLKAAAGQASIEDAKALKASIDEIRQTEESRIQGIEDIIIALEEERNTFGMTTDQIHNYNLSKLEAIDTTKDHAAEIQKEIAILKDLESAFDDVDKAEAEAAKGEYFWEEEERLEEEREKAEKAKKEKKDRASSGDRWGEGRDGVLGGDFGGGSDLSGLMSIFSGGRDRTRGTTPEMQQMSILMAVLMADIGRQWFGSLFGIQEKPVSRMIPPYQQIYAGYGGQAPRTYAAEYIPGPPGRPGAYGKPAEPEEESLLDNAKKLIDSSREAGEMGAIENYGSVIISALGGYERDPSRKFGAEKERVGETEKTVGKYFDGIRKAAAAVFGDVEYSFEETSEKMWNQSDENLKWMADDFKDMGEEAEKSFLGMGYDSDGFFGHIAGGLGKTKEITSVVFDDMENTVAHFCETGKLNYTDFVSSVLTDTFKIINLETAYGSLKGLFGSLFGSGVSAAIGSLDTGPIGGAFGGDYGADYGGAFGGLDVGGGGFGTGEFVGAWGGGDISTEEGNFVWPEDGWAHGGAFPFGISAHSNTITDKPTFFTFAKGAGIYGEAGPEAIMPLTRLPGGDLGVKAEGSATSEPRPLEIHIHEAPGTQTRVEQSDDGNQLNVIVEQVEQAMTGRMSRGTGIAPFMDGRYSRAY